MQIIKSSLVVLGGGPGGYAAAFHAADLGIQTTLIDPSDNPGGVCLYRGCIPSKALLHAVRVISEVEEINQWGIKYGKPEIDLDSLRTEKNKIVGKLTGGLGQLVKQRGVNHIVGQGQILDPRTLWVTKNDGEELRISFDNLIIATGSHPVTLPGIPTGGRIWDSTIALDLPSIPNKLLIVGGGYIGIELGTVYAGLGSQVTVVEMLPGILAGADSDMVAILQKSLKKKFANIYTGTRVGDIKPDETGVTVKFTGEGAPAEERFDNVLVSIGRKPSSAGFGLDKTRVQVDRRGFITVDQQRRTAEPSLWAIGDVAGEPMLAHKASHEARVAVEAIAGHKVAFDPSAIPAVVFTDPEMAWCGLTETQAKEKGIKVEVTRFNWAASGRATTFGRNDGLTKLLIDPETERILGVGIVGVGAGELIAEGVLAVEMASTAADLKLSIHPHPTLSETVMESAELFFGSSTHLFKPKRGKTS